MKQMPMAADDMDSLYQGGDSDEGSPQEEKGETVDQENEEQMSKTAVVPLSVLMGKHTEPLKEGDEVVLKVKAIHGDEAEVEYSETPPGEIGKGESEQGEGMEESADDELDRLGKEY